MNFPFDNVCLFEMLLGEWGSQVFSEIGEPKTEKQNKEIDGVNFMTFSRNYVKIGSWDNNMIKELSDFEGRFHVTCSSYWL